MKKVERQKLVKTPLKLTRETVHVGVGQILGIVIEEVVVQSGDRHVANCCQNYSK